MMWELPGGIGVVILGLACWRLSSLIAREDGPYDVLAKLRYRVGVRYDDHSNPYGINVFAKAITCVWCCSFWVGLALAVFSEYARNFAGFLAVAFALSTIAVIVDQYLLWTQARP